MTFPNFVKLAFNCHKSTAAFPPPSVSIIDVWKEKVKYAGSSCFFFSFLTTGVYRIHIYKHLVQFLITYIRTPTAEE